MEDVGREDRREIRRSLKVGEKTVVGVKENWILKRRGFTGRS